MKMFEILDGRAYLLSVMPSENPFRVLEDERRARRNPRLSLVMVENGIRTVVEGPGTLETDEEEFDFGEFQEDEE